MCNNTLSFKAEKVTNSDCMKLFLNCYDVLRVFLVIFCFFFQQTRPTRKREDETVVQLAENISQLIEHQRTLQPPVQLPTPPPLIHQVQLANIDRMLQQLPPSDVEDAFFEITTLLYNKIKERRDQERFE